MLKTLLKNVRDVCNIIQKYFLWVKSLMGKQLDSIFFIGAKFTKFDLALKKVMKNRWNLVKELTVSFLILWQKNFFGGKGLMGTPPRFQIFFRQHFFKLDLALKWLDENYLKLNQSWSMMFSTIWQENFLVAKSLIGTPVDWKTKFY